MRPGVKFQSLWPKEFAPKLIANGYFRSPLCGRTWIVCAVSPMLRDVSLLTSLSDCEDSSAKGAELVVPSREGSGRENRMVERCDAGGSHTQQYFSVRDRWFWKIQELQPFIATEFFRSHCAHIISLVFCWMYSLMRFHSLEPAPRGTALCLASCGHRPKRRVREETSRSSGEYSPGH